MYAIVIAIAIAIAIECGEDTVFTCPGGRIVGLLKRVAYTGMRGSEAGVAEGQGH